ncbi:MAG: peptidoglycan-binding domain-containing protein, partial [Actinomycetota bacterium]
MNNLRLALRLGVVATTLAALATASVVAPIVLLPVLDADAACTVTVKILPNTRSNSAPCLETRLIGLGYSNIGKPSLLYGAASVRAVKQFQMQRGLYPDGIVTSITARELGLRGPLPTSPSTARVTIIGDSTSAAMRWYDEANDRTTIYDVMGGAYDLVWSLESCRRLVATSCVGRVDPGTGGQWRPVSVLPLMQTSLKGRLGQALVVTAGYDDRDIGTAIEQVMHEAIAQGVPSVFWLTYRTSTTYGYGGYYRQHNAQLAAAAARYPSLRVLDWNAYSHSLPTATQRTWFEKDDVHMTRLGGTGLATWLKHRLAPGHIERCVAATARAGSPATAVGVPAVATTQPGGFQSVAPTRVLDTRVPGLGGGAGALAADQMLTIDLSAALPVDTQSVVLDVVAVHPCQAGVLTVFACGPRPAIGTIALAGSRTAAALAISQVSAGKVCISTTATTDLVIDLEGAFVPGGARFHPVTPRRFLNSRPGISTVTIAGPLTAPRDVTVQVTGNGGVPLDATGAWFNVAAVRATTESALGMSPG